MNQRWEAAYHSALLETDPRQLGEKIHSATVVLQDCLRELAPQQRAGDKQQIVQERQQISDALRALELIRRTELRIGQG
jgi:polyhydroxyalkanoate synthesis regulator phasin